ncbi:uncharacterized protein [Haliaeetus albicilla]|uniref:uncharacterized protein n=1 Tax=Haliaeetus albicilla TaxID=8969 RepID=UPI0037E7FE31
MQWNVSGGEEEGEGRASPQSPQPAAGRGGPCAAPPASLICRVEAGVHECRCPELGDHPCEHPCPSHPARSRLAGVTTQAEAVKEDLRMVRACLARCSAASQSHRALLQCLGQKQQELQKTLERLTSENCLVARCFEESGQELQQLEGQVAQMKKRFQIAKSEAVASLEEAQKAAKAAATSRGAGRDAEQSSALTASSKELLQPRVGMEGLLVHRGWGCRP